ncbi:MAG TPA: PBP1A family penicillin-binding protein [Candidatus Dormibacteraeota bacterium]|nr:PBP1A family penicillin-binding protein [Candidatus Dormibacteraeota bacterium]
MGKKSNQPQRFFYEVLARTPGVVLPGPLPGGKLNLPLWLQIALSDIRALAGDIGSIARRGGRMLAAPQARIAYSLTALAALTAGGAMAAYIAVDTMDKYGSSLNNPALIMNHKKTGTTILDRNGVVLYRGFGATEKHNVPVTSLPESFKQATLAAEDSDFYEHHGVSIKGTSRAIYQNLRHTASVQGGSTITQQLVKNTLLTSERSFVRKYKESVLAVEMERRYSKDEILQMYVNSIYYGQGAYGIDAAARIYFKKAPQELTLEESALLAGLPQSPSIYDPNVSAQSAKERRDYIIERMRLLGMVGDEQARVAASRPVQAHSQEVVIRAPHFVFYVLDRLRSIYGTEIVEKGGITVTTTLDYNKQLAGEQAVREQVAKLAGNHVTNGGLVAMQPKTGDIIAMVGSIDYHQPGFGSVNVTLAQLQPGSSFKPITYATAFSKGWHGATQVDDKPLRISQDNGEVYEPKNYDLKYRGPVLLRRALGNSLNVPAVHVQKFAGIHDTIGMAHNLGVSRPSLVDEGRFGLSLVLGSGEVRPLDMATVYATFAASGTKVLPRSILKVEDRFARNITKEARPAPKQVIDPRLSYMITHILSDNKNREEIFGANSPLVLSRPAAVKTGTTNDFRDNWTIGYTPSFVTAVWVGNNDHTPMHNVDGITGAAPIWHRFMESALAGTPVEEFTRPEGLVNLKVCKGDGGLADANDASAIEEVFLAENQPTKRCGASGEPKPVLVEAQPKPKPDTPVKQAEAAPPGCGTGEIGCGGGTPPPEEPKKKEEPTPDPGGDSGSGSGSGLGGGGDT